MIARLAEKAHLSAKGLIRNVFKKIKKPLTGGQGQAKEISLTDKKPMIPIRMETQ